MQAFEVTRGAVKPGIPVHGDDGQKFVLVGESVRYESIGHARDTFSGEKVFLTAALAASTPERLMAAVRLPEMGAGNWLHTGNQDDGAALVLISTEGVKYKFLPTAADFCLKHTKVYNGYSPMYNCYFLCVLRRPGDGIIIGEPAWRRGPREMLRREMLLKPTAFVRWDGGELECTNLENR